MSGERATMIRIRNNAQLESASRTTASLALQQLRQEGVLRVRQRDQLHRALSAAGEEMDWALIPGSSTDRVDAATKDMVRLTEAGAKALERDVVALLDEKKAEVKELKKVLKAINALAASDKTTYPTEISYSHTARSGSQGLYTKVETVTVNDAGEAESAAAALEKKLDKFGKLRDEMLVETKLRKRQIEEMRKSVSDFVGSSKGIVRDVLATLT